MEPIGNCISAIKHDLLGKSAVKSLISAYAYAKYCMVESWFILLRMCFSVDNCVKL